MVKQRPYFLDYKQLSELFLNISAGHKNLPNYLFQIFPTKFVMSNEKVTENLIESSKNEATRVLENKNESKKKHKYTKEERKQDRKARLALKQETKAVGFHDNESLKQTQYYFENGLRKVKANLGHFVQEKTIFESKFYIF